MPNSLDLWKVIDRELLLSAQPWFDVWREKIELPDKRIIPDYHKIDMRDVCSVVAVTSEHEILVFKQYKHGVGAINLGLPAGYMEKEEEPLQTAMRELLEETGYESAHWTELGQFVRNGNQGCGSMHVFLALDAKQTTEPVVDDLEEQQLLFMTMSDLLHCFQNGQIRIMSVALSLLLANQHLYQASSDNL